MLNKGKTTHHIWKLKLFFHTKNLLIVLRSDSHIKECLLHNHRAWPYSVTFINIHNMNSYEMPIVGWISCRLT